MPVHSLPNIILQLAAQQHCQRRVTYLELQTWKYSEVGGCFFVSCLFYSYFRYSWPGVQKIPLKWLFFWQLYSQIAETVYFQRCWILRFRLFFFSGGGGLSYLYLLCQLCKAFVIMLHKQKLWFILEFQLPNLLTLEVNHIILLVVSSWSIDEVLGGEQEWASYF